jgi:filamentous hemagglutinin family protein
MKDHKQFSRNLLRHLIGVWVAIGCLRNSAIAQVTSDRTAGSRVSGTSAIQINGGTVRGNTLFHSFEQFSVPSGGSVLFNNSTNTAHILSRVTGSTVSSINGLLAANGNANVFLINPNGIIFGAEAQLQIGGSFIATTANAIALQNGDRFSTDSTQPFPNQLLNVNPNAFLFNQLAAKPIINRSIAGSVGLSVLPQQSLLLIGGDILLEDGRMIAPDANVRLAGVAGSGTIGLSQDFRLSVPEQVARSQVTLNSTESPINFDTQSLIDVRGNPGGRIEVTADNLTLNQSDLITGIAEGMGVIGAKSGDITINVAGTMALNSFSNIQNNTFVDGIGDAGNINITTESLSIFDVSGMTTRTEGQGNSGNLRIVARDVVLLDANSSLDSGTGFSSVGNGGEIHISTNSFSALDGSRITATLRGEGQAGTIRIDAEQVEFGAGTLAISTVGRRAIGIGGDIRINTGSLSLTNDAQLRTGILSQGEGQGGNIMINARDRVFLDGVGEDGIFNSAILNTVDSRASGNSGNIRITTKELIASNGAHISAQTAGQGNAGNIFIDADSIVLSGTSPDVFFSSGIYSIVNQGARGKGGNIQISTGSLSVNRGAQIASSTLATGSSGDIKIDARGAIALDGVSSDGQYESGIFSNVEVGAVGDGGITRISTGSLTISNGAQILSSTFGTGDAGDIRVDARGAIAISGKAADGPSGIFVSAEGNGAAGNLNVTAQKIQLDQQGAINAESFSGNGGDIDLTVQSLVFLRRGSLISASAGTAEAGGNGGNIRISAPLVVAIPTDNSDIRANAFLGEGGSISIATKSLIGIQPRTQATDLSDITASSQFGLQGTVSINGPNVDPSRGVSELPIEIRDSSRLIAKGCASDRGSTFVVTGRGGLPDDPRQALSEETLWTDQRVQTTAQTAEIPQDWVQAQDWVIDSDGMVHLVAHRASEAERVASTCLRGQKS